MPKIPLLKRIRPFLRRRKVETPVAIRRRRSAAPPSGTNRATARPSRVAPGTAFRAETGEPPVPGLLLVDGDAPGKQRRATSTWRSAREWWNSRVQLSAALLCWGAWATIVYALSPDDHAARAGFFAALFAASFFTLVPLFQGIWLQFARSRLHREAAGMHATRQALEVSVAVTLNAFLQVQRAWSLLTAVLLLVVFIIIEFIALSRR